MSKIIRTVGDLSPNVNLTLQTGFNALAGARTIGLTGSAEKCRWLIEELGYDIVINYHDSNWYEQLEKAAPTV